MFEHHVGENEHFAHGGHNGDLRRFPLIAQMLVIWLDLGITPDGYDSCHVENTAHRYPSARDVRLSTHEAPRLSVLIKSLTKSSKMAVAA